MFYRRFISRIAILFFLTSFIGCKKKQKCWTPPPGDDIYFVIKEHGSIIKDNSFLKGISLLT